MSTFYTAPAEEFDFHIMTNKCKGFLKKNADLVKIQNQITQLVLRAYIAFIVLYYENQRQKMYQTHNET